MRIACGEPNPRELEILQMIRDTVREAEESYWQAGFDEAWDEQVENSDILIDEAYEEGFAAGVHEAGRRSGDDYEAGYNAAINQILRDYIEPTGWVMTPESIEELHSMTESFSENGYMTQMLTLNYLNQAIRKMKND